MLAWGREGDARKLRLLDLPEPDTGSTSVLIAPKALGVNFIDTLDMQLAPGTGSVPGIEVAGTVIATGTAVHGFHPGDRVFAFVPNGGFAQKVVAPASRVVHLPDALSFADAAAGGIGFGTAHYGLVRRGGASAGQTLIITGATGATGLCALSLGKALGMSVVACGTNEEKLRIATQLGADLTVNQGRARLSDILCGTKADLVYDTAGGPALSDAIDCLAHEGKVISIGCTSASPLLSHIAILTANIDFIGISFGAFCEDRLECWNDDLGHLFRMQAEGAITTHVYRHAAFEALDQALDDLTSRRNVGKVLVTL